MDGENHTRLVYLSREFHLALTQPRGLAGGWITRIAEQDALLERGGSLHLEPWHEWPADNVEHPTRSESLAWAVATIVATVDWQHEQIAKRHNLGNSNDPTMTS